MREREMINEREKGERKEKKVNLYLFVFSVPGKSKHIKLNWQHSSTYSCENELRTSNSKAFGRGSLSISQK